MRIKYFIVIFFIIFLTTDLSAQKKNQIKSQFTKNLLTYIDQRKDPGTALISELILPGGGFFYLNNFNSGMIFFTLEICAAYYFINYESNNIIFLVPFKLILSIYSAFNTKNYNDKLKEQLSLDLYIQK